MDWSSFNRYLPLVLSPEGSLPSGHPVDEHKCKDNKVNYRDVVHVIRFHGLDEGERVHDQCEKSPHQQYPISKQAELAKPKRAMFDVITAFDEERHNWDTVRDVQ